MTKEEPWMKCCNGLTQNWSDCMIMCSGCFHCLRIGDYTNICLFGFYPTIILKRMNTPLHFLYATLPHEIYKRLTRKIFVVSMVNYYAPTFDDATSIAFHNNPKLQQRLRDALVRMLSFYGFDTNIPSTLASVSSAEPSQSESESEHKLPNLPKTITIDPSFNFSKFARNWFNSHNDLRITRIIRCLRVAGMEPEAQAFYEALKKLYESQEGYPRPIKGSTYIFWTRAAKRDIRIPPSMSDAQAENMLKEF